MYCGMSFKNKLNLNDLLYVHMSPNRYCVMYYICTCNVHIPLFRCSLECTPIHTMYLNVLIIKVI